MCCTEDIRERENPGGAWSDPSPLLLDLLLAPPPPSSLLPQGSPLGPAPANWAQGLTSLHQRQHLVSQTGMFLLGYPGSWPGSTLQRGCRPISASAPTCTAGSLGN